MTMIYSELHLQLEAVDNLNFARNLKRFLHHGEDTIFVSSFVNLIGPLLYCCNNLVPIVLVTKLHEFDDVWSPALLIFELTEKISEWLVRLCLNTDSVLARAPRLRIRVVGPSKLVREAANLFPLCCF